MRVVSIGNSFSQDAQRYISQIAKNYGERLDVINLYIGGCSLNTHYNNLVEDNNAYELQFNGVNADVKVSIKQALESMPDVITLQQASKDSVNYKTYKPYLTELYNYAKKVCPNAKIMLHETWAYQDGSEKLATLNYTSFDDMFKDVKKAYKKAQKDFEFDGVLPSGSVMQTAIKLGLEHSHNDGLHASLGAGRYMLGLTWFKVLTGIDITKDKFNNFDEPVTKQERKIIIKAVNKIVK
ncbi:MAG: DUF4886 domain-containing protein [Clostridia bacterium]|nr:DUF4886 domain-containing protein [Clostridia bacterium]